MRFHGAMLWVIVLLLQVVPRPASADRLRDCDKAAARKTLSTITASPPIARIVEEDGWVVVTFGSGFYATSTPEKREVLITAIANSDACITGRRGVWSSVRRLESLSGEQIGCGEFNCTN